MELLSASIPYGFAEGLQTLRTLRCEHPKIVAEGKGILAFLARLVCQLLELRLRGLFVYKKQTLPLRVDFQPIDIILVGPFADVRKYAQLTRSHALRFAFYSKTGSKWQRRKCCQVLPKRDRQGIKSSKGLEGW